MLDILTEILDWQAAGESVAIATVVTVQGSAPRPVGATMAVSSTGRMTGSVSGGCVETTVFGELMDILEGGAPRLLHFGITEDMIWDVGLACGGIIEVFAQPLSEELASTIAQHWEQGLAFCLATTMTGDASGTTNLITAETTPSDAASSAIVSAAQEMLTERREKGMVKNLAEIQVYLEPYLAQPLLVIIGGVHVAVPLSQFGRELGFRVIVADPRAKFANRDRFPLADEVLLEWPDEALAHIEIDEATYIVVLTHDPKIDEPTLAAALQTQAAYIGAIGSRGTHAERFKRMAAWGVSPEDLDRVHAPIGLDLGGGTPAETALSIISEIIAVKNGRSGGSLRKGSGPISNGPGACS